jgi:tRNA pseudouridine55 synthase
LKRSGILPIYKPKGITPHQLIEQLRKEQPPYQDVVIGYAGRLDPLAHGLMLLMLGDETKNRDNYLSLSKEYTFEILLGVETDTYDVLGIINPPLTKGAQEDLNAKIHSFIASKLGTHQQPYPPYSSKAVHGKPLHWWARNNKLEEITLPTREVTITDFQLSKITKKTRDVIQADIFQQIAAVSGDFRQQAIKESWEVFFKTNNYQTFETATFQLSCSSGTYVRSLAHELGKQLGTGAITLDILRTRVGDYYLPLTNPLSKL